MKWLLSEKESFSIETEKAKIARWFSKDKDGLPVYHGQDGNAYFVTRDEQDAWLEEAYSYAEKIDNPTPYQKEKTCFLIFSFFYIWLPVLLGLDLDLLAERSRALFLIFALSYIATFFASPLLLLLWSKDIFFVKFFQNKKLRYLKNTIERKVHFRDEIPFRIKRYNLFRIVGVRFGMLIFLYGFFVHGHLFPYMAGLIDNMLIMLFGAVVMVMFSNIAKRLDGAHVRQTGKWFRWPRRA